MYIITQLSFVFIYVRCILWLPLCPSLYFISRSNRILVKCNGSPHRSCQSILILVDIGQILQPLSSHYTKSGKVWDSRDVDCVARKFELWRLIVYANVSEVHTASIVRAIVVSDAEDRGSQTEIATQVRVVKFHRSFYANRCSGFDCLGIPRISDWGHRNLGHYEVICFLLQVRPLHDSYQAALNGQLTEAMNVFWAECYEGSKTAVHRRNREMGESKLRFQVLPHSQCIHNTYNFALVIGLSHLDAVLTRFKRAIAEPHSQSLTVWPWGDPSVAVMPIVQRKYSNIANISLIFVAYKTNKL